MEIGLKVTPESLYIEGPYDKQKWTRFALINEQPKNQVFKIKSTRPESISVSPNSGFIKSYERIEILVTLAGDCFDPMIRNREKFLIQSAFTVVPCSASDLGLFLGLGVKMWGRDLFCCACCCWLSSAVPAAAGPPCCCACRCGWLSSAVPAAGSGCACRCCWLPPAAGSGCACCWLWLCCASVGDNIWSPSNDGVSHPCGQAWTPYG